ncbi:unnamed protein product [Gongylonema pulchrum]|uniref:Uncharacterized protein n=1 Tax=Gongylonema pulchrum TaxID=637853 RepID=A0A183EZ44_9BILA|nr:unnamed protein product [Gongylonema pulchrum]
MANFLDEGISEKFGEAKDEEQAPAEKMSRSMALTDFVYLMHLELEKLV